MGQKFLRGHRVQLQAVAPKHMTHFDGFGHEAIVVYSYRDAHGGKGPHDYSLLILPSMHRASWYPEDLLTLVDANRDAGEAILQEFSERRA